MAPHKGGPIYTDWETSRLTGGLGGAKRCVKCGKLRGPQAFAKDRAKGPNGRQSWCRDCKHGGRYMDWDQAYRSFRVALRQRAGSEEWSVDRYKQLFMARPTGKARVTGRCFYCACDVWITNGYHVDRQDSDRGYTWDNCVPSCSPCNRVKNSLPPLVFLNFSDWMREKYPDGFPWASTKWSAFRFRDETDRLTGPYSAPNRQQLPLPGTP